MERRGGEIGDGGWVFCIFARMRQLAVSCVGWCVKVLLGMWVGVEEAKGVGRVGLVWSCVRVMVSWAGCCGT